MSGSEEMGSRLSKRLVSEGLLAEQQSEIASLCVDGLSRKEIANELDIATSTVNSHVQSINEKIDSAKGTLNKISSPEYITELTDGVGNHFFQLSQEDDPCPVLTLVRPNTSTNQKYSLADADVMEFWSVYPSEFMVRVFTGRNTVKYYTIPRKKVSCFINDWALPGRFPFENSLEPGENWFVTYLNNAPALERELKNTAVSRTHLITDNEWKNPIDTSGVHVHEMRPFTSIENNELVIGYSPSESELNQALNQNILSFEDVAAVTETFIES